MIPEFVFASNNKHKLEEIRAIAKDKIRIVCPEDFGFFGEIPENQISLEGNALQKARFIYDKFSLSCFADDTGLEVEALNGRPGVYSARYAGEGKNSSDNVKKLLNELYDIPNRNARFRTVIALVVEDKEYFFEGVAEGKIIDELRGKNGFGYDPIFIPLGLDETFAEIPVYVKNRISHRALAFDKLFNFLTHLK